MPAEGSQARSTCGSTHNLQGTTSEVAASDESSAAQPSQPKQPNRQPSTAPTGALPGYLHWCLLKASLQQVHLPIKCHDLHCITMSHSLH